MKAHDGVWLLVYDYADLVCSAKLSTSKLPAIGEEVEVDFNDPAVESGGGSWGDCPEGSYCFTVHFHEDGAAVCQFAMDYAEDDPYWC